MKPLKLLLENMDFSERLSEKLYQGDVKDKKKSKSEKTSKDADESSGGECSGLRL